MVRRSRLLRELARLWRRDDRGVSAVEFAIALPFLITLYFGGYQVTQAVSAYRKLTILTRTVADLSTQSASQTSSSVSAILNASAQVMVPFNTSSLSILVTDINCGLTTATVAWSQVLNGAALSAAQQQKQPQNNSTVSLPANVCQPGASIILSSVIYYYTPAVGYKITGPIVMSDHLYMNPRLVAFITYSN